MMLSTGEPEDQTAARPAAEDTAFPSFTPCPATADPTPGTRWEQREKFCTQEPRTRKGTWELRVRESSLSSYGFLQGSEFKQTPPEGRQPEWPCLGLAWNE